MNGMRMDHLNNFEVENKLLDFYNMSGEDWMRHVESKYTRTLVFQSALDHYYAEYIKEKNSEEPSFEMPRYRPGQAFDAVRVKEYARDAKLKEIVDEFYDFYQTHKAVLERKERRG
jgi:hypothetical protein